MVYFYYDIGEFTKEINDLKWKGLIRDNKCPHSSPTFVVRNYAKIKQEKARVVINYKKLNDNTKKDGNFILNKQVIFNRI